ncbi:MAG: FAD-dependent oxidoreductase, partial [Pseudomonadota bacterium]|nr:FAD-dependent oxidoreductase [Pseudomonadota bacterium]
DGAPRHHRGVAAMPGVYFLGLPWQTCRASSFICGVWRDAQYIAGHIAADRRYQAYRPGVGVR